MGGLGDFEQPGRACRYQPTYSIDSVIEFDYISEILGTFARLILYLPAEGLHISKQLGLLSSYLAQRLTGEVLLWTESLDVSVVSWCFP